MEAFSKRLKDLRAESGKLQADVSSDLNLSRGIMSAYENGREPPFETLIAIARYFNVSTDYLLGLSENRRPSSDTLSAAVDQAAVAVAAMGAKPVTVSDLLSVAHHLSRYCAIGAPAGIAPAVTVSQLVSGMDTLLSALASGSAASVLDAVNLLLSSVLSVSDVGAEYFKRSDLP